MSALYRAPLTWATSVEAAARSASRKAVDPAALAGLPQVHYIEFRDEKAGGTHGGDSSTGSWLKRDINTKHADTTGLATASASQITLPAGTYECEISCPGYALGRHQARLRNVTDGAITLMGRGGVTPGGSATQTESTITGRFTIAASKTFEIQHAFASAQANGLGTAANLGPTEIYTVARFWKVA